MKMLAEYLEKALNFERMAAHKKDAALKASLEQQAAAELKRFSIPRHQPITKISPVRRPTSVKTERPTSHAVRAKH
jgi:hypothetical protein